jgi:outer membrane protein insertion porin family
MRFLSSHRRDGDRRVTRPGTLSVCAILFALLTTTSALAQDQPPAEPQPTLRRLVIESTTVFTADDIAWLLHLRTGSPLPAKPEEIAARLKRLYEKEGYTAVTVTERFDEATGALTLTVNETRIDDVQFRGANATLERRIRDELEQSNIRAGQPFNATAITRAVRRVIAATNGAYRLEDIDLVEVNGRQVVVVPVDRRAGNVNLSLGSDGREDLYTPVDGFAPGVGFTAVAYDRSGFNYTLVNGFVSWKFGPDAAGYSLGVERPLLSNTRLFLGTEIHDLSASDDGWRISPAEQTFAVFGVRRSFRDYYRRRGMQVFAGFRPSAQHEVLASMRWDRHEPLANEADYSLFRGDDEFRPNPLVADAELNALVFGYTFDTRGLDQRSLRQRYVHHLADDLYRGVRRAAAGLRVDWTSEIAGHGFGGDYEFTRHILNARTILPVGRHQTIAARGLFGWSDGELPLERQFAVGGLGSVRGHDFKGAAGSGMTLVNAEYSLNVAGSPVDAHGSLKMLLLFDAGRVREPVRGTDDWINGLGVGLQTGPLRFEWGWDLERSPKYGRFYMRLGRGF